MEPEGTTILMGFIVVIIIIVIIVMLFSEKIDGNTNPNNSEDFPGDYQGDYDGGHNKRTKPEKPNEIQNTAIMHDLRNLTISSTNPCLIIYLLDQSASMEDKFGNAPHSKAVELSKAINDTIYEVGLRCIGNAGELKNRFEIAVIGYGKGSDLVQSAWEGQLANKWWLFRSVYATLFGSKGATLKDTAMIHFFS